MEKTNGAASIMNLTAQAGLANLPNINRQTQVDGGMSFTETFMKTSEVKSPVFMNEPAATTQTAVDPASKSMSANIKTSPDVKQQKEQSLDSNEMKDLAKEVKDITDQIKDKIKEGFEVTDEEIEEAMEVLGLTIADLANGADLRNLIMELTGTTDSIELITNVDLYDGLKEVTALADELLTQVSEKFEIPKEQLMDIINSDSFNEALAEKMNEVTGMTEDAEPVILTEEREAVKTVIKDTELDDEPVTPQVKVEVEISEEARTSNPVLPSQQTEGNSTGNDKRNDLSKNDSNKNDQIAAVQTTTTQTVNTVGDIVETVTSYTSYTDTQNNVMRQVTDFVRVNITEDTTEMELRLHPASLGTVNMQINSQNGQITAHLTVQNELVKSILETQMVRLQETFNEQGTKVSAIEISVANYNLDRDNSNNYPQSDEGNRRNGRRAINLSEIDSLDDLTEDEQLEAEVMEMNGSSVTYTV